MKADEGSGNNDLNVGCYAWHVYISIAKCQHNKSVDLCQCSSDTQVAAKCKEPLWIDAATEA